MKNQLKTLLSLFIGVVVFNDINAQNESTNGYYQSNIGSGLKGIFMQYTSAQANSFTRGILSHNIFWDGTNWKTSTNVTNDAQAIAIRNNNGFSFIIHEKSGTGERIFDHTQFMSGTKMVINADGNVGIGTTGPSTRLAVDGWIKAQGADGRLMLENPSVSTSVYLRNSGSSGQRKFEILYGTTAKYVMDNAGNVGIGTTNPGYKLEVNGANDRKVGNFIGDNSLDSYVSIGNTSSGSAKLILDGQNGDVVGGDYATIYNVNSSTPVDRHLRFQTNAADRMTIDGSGNVGIGTTSPNAKLTIEPGANTSTSLHGKDFHLGILIKPVSGRSGFMALTENDWINGAANDGHFVSAFPFDNVASRNDDLTWKAFRLLVGSNLEDKFWVNKLGDGYFSGNVSIGTTTPATGYKLSVAGKIISEEVKVKLQSSGWPDYVFSKNYRLKSLSETEEYIKEEGHLPNIPSAEEVAENGIELGEMNARLLQKIEELTLHLINQQKEIEALKKEVKAMK